MKFQVTARGGLDLSPALREHVRQRIHFALSRFSGRIERVSVRLADVNGPRGGLDKVCAIRVDAKLKNPVIVREIQDDVHSAVAAAAGRAERGIERRLRLLSRTRRNELTAL